MFAQSSRSSLVNDQQIDAFVRAMFSGAAGRSAAGVRLVLTVGGRTLSDEETSGAVVADEETRAAIRELTRSLEMYGIEQPGETIVQRPTAERIERALEVLADPAPRRKTLGAALNIFGHRVIAPLESVLRATDAGITPKLLALRETLLGASLEGLHLTHETLGILRGDLLALLSDQYLATLGDNEERVLRPRLTELAQRVMDVLAGTFHRALDRFGAHARGIADRIVRRLPVEMALRDVPTRLRDGFVRAVAEFLEVETSAELRGTLATLSAQYADVTPAEHPLGFSDAWFRDVAETCWDVIVTYC